MTMHNNTQNIIEKMKKVVMNPEEKAVVRSSLLQFIKEHPVEGASGTRTTVPSPLRVPSLSPVEYWWGSITVGSYRATFALVLVCLVTAGTSYAARGALPGDVLYAVKINVNENAQSLLAFDAKSAAEVETQHALARLDEAQTLAASGKLTPAVHAQIETTLNNTVTALDRRVAELNDKGDYATAIDVNETLEHALSDHYALLFNETTNDTSDNRPNMFSAKMTSSTLAPVAATLSPESSASTTISGGHEVRSLKQNLDTAQGTAAENASTTASEKIANVKAYLAGNNTTTIDVKLASEIFNKLAKADQLFAAAVAKYNKNKYEEALSLFKQASRVAEEARIIFAINSRVSDERSKQEKNSHQVEREKNGDLKSSVDERNHGNDETDDRGSNDH